MIRVDIEWYERSGRKGYGSIKNSAGCCEVERLE